MEQLIDQDQTEGLEVIVVDDGSQDETLAQIRVLASRSHVPVKVLEGEGRGPSAARNLGINNSSGDLIAFVDDDTLPPKGWIREMRAGIERHPDGDCFVGRILLPDGVDRPRACGRETMGDEIDLGESDIETVPDRVLSCNMAVRRATVDERGGFDENLPIYGEDTEWAHRLTSGGGPIWYVAGAWLWHMRSPSDLRVRSIAVRGFRTGRGWARIANLRAQEVSVVQALWHMIKGVGHLVVGRCWGGLFHAAFWLGCARQCLSILFARSGRPYVRLVPSWRFISSRLGASSKGPS